MSYLVMSYVSSDGALNQFIRKTSAYGSRHDRDLTRTVVHRHGVFNITSESMDALPAKPQLKNIAGSWRAAAPAKHGERQRRYFIAHFLFSRCRHTFISQPGLPSLVRAIKGELFMEASCKESLQ